MSIFNKKNDEEMVTIKTIPLTGNESMAMLQFLPPDVVEAILKDITNGSKGGMPITEPEKVEKKTNKIKYDYGMVNCNQDLKTLVEKLKKSDKRAYSILLYGVSGSGKSYFGKYLAQELKMPFIKKKASDLQDKFIGETEKRIRDAFAEAREKGAVLILDECDSFLFDRKFAQRDFECTSVNELLVQLEEHTLPVILTSNLKDKLDKAVFRRILFKIKFDYMKPENIQAGVKTYFGRKYKLNDEQLKDLKYLSAGDFTTAKQKADILDDGAYTNQLIHDYLLTEQEEKGIEEGSAEINF